MSDESILSVALKIGKLNDTISNKKKASIQYEAKILKAQLCKEKSEATLPIDIKQKDRLTSILKTLYEKQENALRLEIMTKTGESRQRHITWFNMYRSQLGLESVSFEDCLEENPERQTE